VLWAVTVTALVGTLAGALYTPAVVIVPTVELPPAMPDTSQFTPVFVVPVTQEVNWSDCPTSRLVLVGEMETDTDAGMIVTVASASLVPSVAATPIDEVEERLLGAV